MWTRGRMTSGDSKRGCGLGTVGPVDSGYMPTTCQQLCASDDGREEDIQGHEQSKIAKSLF